MKFHPVRLGFVRSLVALSVSFAVVLSTHAFAFAALTRSAGKSTSQPALPQKQTQPERSELQLTSVTATATAAGILLEWHSGAATDNLGFNIYRLKDGRRTRVNREIIPGALFAPNAPALMRGGYSYSWIDRGGTADSTYYIESVDVWGTTKIHEAIPVVKRTGAGFEQTPETLGAGSETESTNTLESYYPAGEAKLNSANGAIEDQWAIAAQSALKIGIKKDGWYRVTQPQMAAAGFNPGVDIRNLSLFVDANEVAINTSQNSGPLGSGDYIEFYGRGLDTPTTDTRTYYLIAGTAPGKRVRGELQLDSSPTIPAVPAATPPASPGPQPSQSPTPASGSLPAATPTGPMLRDPVFYSWVDRDLNVWIDSLRAAHATRKEIEEDDNPRAGFTQAESAQPYSSQSQVDISQPRDAQPAVKDQATGALGRSGQKNTSPLANVVPGAAVRTTTTVESPSPPFPVLTRSTRSLRLPVLIKAGQLRKRTGSKKRKGSKLRRGLRRERNHAAVSVASAPANFDYTVERKDRTVYFVSLLNGDQENWFGQVISSGPASQTITISNPDLTATGSAQVEVALQGVNVASHQVSVQLNGMTLGLVTGFFGQSRMVATFNVPVSLLNNGANTLKFTPQTCTPACPDTTLVDYARLTYPHQFRADADRLKFSLRGTQSVDVDGFATSSVRLIDYTDPLNVGIIKPASDPSGSGFAVTVPRSDPLSKPPRLLYAIPEGQFEQPASLLLNQPSSLNSNSNAADFLIVCHKDFIASVEPLRVARSQGMTAKTVDVEDVYDEFSYGVHGPQAIKNFLSHASTHWATKPRYIVFAGDASLDPRNYQGSGNFDFVPTKLVDATFSETASDDWLADFDNDGIADTPVGRLPVRTVGETNLVISKIINFSPANVPQSALLVADQDDQFHSFQFVEANDAIQSQLPASMTVQRINRGTPGTPPDSQIKLDISASLNSGRAVVGYSGHGNVNVWTGAAIFTASEARNLTNGSKLSFVVVMDCLNGYFQDPSLESMSEAFLKAPAGGAVAAFASSGLTIAQGQHVMSQELYFQLYGNPQSLPLGDAIKIAKAATFDDDVKRTWIFFGDPSIKIR
jgi:hypothetical protein